ncbi:iron chelate uptake ABC transporter family permease subunit, partial [bacterium]|nr:iron chelate uptake ABC transporter family permease subunit [candidate division CSSED10-310 bacterium]
GTIGWIGLVVPHITRLLVGADHERLVPLSGLTGAIVLVVMDGLARSLFTMELPIGILTAFLGAPFFLYLLVTRESGF